MPESDALVGDVEFAADLAEHVQEGHHFRLGGALDEDVAMGGERGGRPGGCLDAIRQRRVRVPLQFLDTLDAEGAINVHRNDCAHLLQHAHQIHDLRFDGGAGKLGLAFGEHGGEQRLLGGAHGRVRQVDLRAMQTVRSGDVNAVLVFLVDVRAEFAQGFQMEVNRTSANRAAAQRGNERFTQTVHERAGEQDRDARRTGQCIHVGHIGQLHTRGVDGHNAVRTVHIHVHAVQT